MRPSARPGPLRLHYPRSSCSGSHSATKNSIAEAFDVLVLEISLQANESKRWNSRHIEMAKQRAEPYQNSDAEGVLGLPMEAMNVA